ncbi:MAG: hypothetical protein ETSY1_04375 [Candidatus Entotheonella factor]|uniref:Outer membrane protein beta-barrel domain-containing protein n=1 Tax=Entotheonella factor TaxID=1429438 RepID=W4LWE7_ENTF1|nr:MAG: hypothetical protein ETSY1_04375 [Candidatus Entotheonella factor]
MHGWGMSQEREEFMTMGIWGRTRILTVLLVSFLAPALAWGQVLTLTPSLTIEERYDDNIFQRSGEADPVTGVVEEEEDDFITTISPAVQLRYIPRPETVVTFEYQPAFRIFADHSGQNHVSHRLDFTLESPLSRRFSLEIGEQLVITEEPGDRTREVDDPGGNLDAFADSDEERERTIRNTANISLNAGLTPRLSLGLLFENLIEEVDDNDELDEFRYVIGTELGYLTNVARQNRAIFTYTATIFTFSNNCDVGEAGCTPQNDEGFTVHTVTGGYEHNLSATLTARASIGYATTASDRDDLDGNDAVVGSIGFIQTLRTGQAALSFERSFTSGGGTSDEVVSSRFIGRLRFQPTPKVTTALSGSLAILDFEQANVNALNDDDRTFFTIRPTIQYQVLRYLGFNAAYNFSLSNFQEDERADRTDHRFSIGAVFAIRAGLFVDLTYQHRNRKFDSTPGENREDGEFTRNEVILSLTYRPTFRF